MRIGKVPEVKDQQGGRVRFHEGSVLTARVVWNGRGPAGSGEEADRLARFRAKTVTLDIPVQWAGDRA